MLTCQSSPTPDQLTASCCNIDLQTGTRHSTTAVKLTRRRTRECVEESITIKNLTTMKNFNTDAVIATPKRQLLVCKNTSHDSCEQHK